MGVHETCQLPVLQPGFSVEHFFVFQLPLIITRPLFMLYVLQLLLNLTLVGLGQLVIMVIRTLCKTIMGWQDKCYL